MHPFIPVAVFLLCVIQGNGDKLAAASNDDDFDDDEREDQIALALDPTDSIEESNATLTEDADAFTYAYESSARSLENGKTKHQHYIVHGWRGNMYEEWINDTSKAILKHSDSGVIRFGYSKPAALNYFSAVSAVKREVGKQLGQHIIGEYEGGRVSLDKLTLIGHGLGAHVIGIAGKTIFKKLGKKVERIIGLSPAGPIFHITSKDKKLQKSDAECVAVVHTDKLLLGYKFAIGGLDFYANKGIYQPGCEIFSQCSHRRSRLYLIEAFEKATVPELEQARSLNSNSDSKKFIDMVHGSCSMGNGSYYFNTNSKPPYLLDN